MDDELADVADACKLVKLHVGIQHAAGEPVHDSFFIERVADAHNQGAVDLAFRSPQVDDETAVLRRHHAIDSDDAGFCVH